MQQDDKDETYFRFQAAVQRKEASHVQIPGIICLGAFCVVHAAVQSQNKGLTCFMVMLCLLSDAPPALCHVTVSLGHQLSLAGFLATSVTW